MTTNTTVVVPLGACGDQLLNRIKSEEGNRRLREWSLGVMPAIIREGGRWWAEKTKGSNRDWRKRSTFRRGAMVRSYAAYTDTVVTFYLADNVYSVGAPRGYHWAVDANGLFLRGACGDYHPDATEMIVASHNKCRSLVQAIKDNRRKRIEASKEAKRFARAVATVVVTIDDSRRAGNCVQGTLSFAERRLGVDRETVVRAGYLAHVPAAKLLSVSNGDYEAVRRAVAMAEQRLSLVAI